MAVHIELDFNDDGTIVMTHRPAPGAEPVQTRWETLPPKYVKITRVLAGPNFAHSHSIMLSGASTMESIQDSLGIHEPSRCGAAQIWQWSS